jgi:hypothetical protein
MRQLLAHPGITAIHKLGSCMYCMRAAFLSALFSSLMALVFFAAAPGSVFSKALIVIAALLSILWISHLIAYAARTARYRVFTAMMNTNGVEIKHTRRELFPIFLKSFLAIAFATALQTLPTAVQAQGVCPSNQPYHCGTRYCCAGHAIWFCSGYTGNAPNWRSMGTFCTNANTNEDIYDLRSHCAILVRC